MAIDIGTFLAPDSFKNLVGRLIDALMSSPFMEGSALTVFFKVGDELVNGPSAFMLHQNFLDQITVQPWVMVRCKVPLFMIQSPGRLKKTVFE